MPLELLTWYLPTLEMDDDDDDDDVGQRGHSRGNFFCTYLYTKLLLLAAIMILKSHRCYFVFYLFFLFRFFFFLQLIEKL